MKKIKVKCNEVKPARVFDLEYENKVLYAAIKIPGRSQPKQIRLNEYLMKLGIQIIPIM